MSIREATVYPPDALAGRTDLDVISPDQAPTLDAQFRERVRRNGDRIACMDYDFEAECWRDYTWLEIGDQVSRWQAAMSAQGLRKGDHVGIRLRNCRHWMIFDQAALGLGLVVVPLYVADRPDNVNYVLDHADVKLLLVETQSDWLELESADGDTPKLRKVIVVETCEPNGEFVVCADHWLRAANETPRTAQNAPDELASIVYTSGTTGRPKGVMLSHANMVQNAHAGLRMVAVTPDDLLLSFLPLSHTLERTVGYYLPLMAGACIAYARSIPHLAEDLVTVKPTGAITVPRVFERVYSELKTKIEQGSVLQRVLFDATVNIGWSRFLWRQGRGAWKPAFLIWPLLDFLVARRVRSRLGGRLRLAVVGGAPLPVAVSRVFLSLGVTLLQGYGLTESSPSISINTLEQNKPATIGLPLHGVTVRIGDNSELLAKGPNIMLGYWDNADATAEVLKDGWLYTGDQACIDEDGFISITGRIKDILVLANGEKVPPADMESAIIEDPLFDQSMVVGEQMPFLSVIVVLNPDRWRRLCGSLSVAADDLSALSTEPVQQFLLKRIGAKIQEFPGYARIYRVTATLDPWTVENGLITPTLKIKRAVVKQRFDREIEKMYEGHETFKTEVRRSA